MLFKLLKLFGFDLAAEIEAARVGFERRAERAADRIKSVAQDAAVIAALGVLATATATMAFIVGLIALYRITAQLYGDYAGLGAVAAILIVMTAGFAAVGVAKASKLSSTPGAGEPRGRSSASQTTAAESHTTATEQAAAITTVREPDRSILPFPSPAAPRDLIDPLALVLSEVVEVPRLGNPVIDELIGRIRTTARGTADEAVYRAADVIRHGGPADLILVLTGTAALAWLITRNARPRA
jgi:hypothetical protein